MEEENGNMDAAANALRAQLERIEEENRVSWEEARRDEATVQEIEAAVQEVEVENPRLQLSLLNARMTGDSIESDRYHCIIHK